ncbi:Rieske 2Fe-2S domain-containing protein [Alphaproteobacteria bacterium]|nr:Rieske 2Fe-2S domain-containing protein [Alphaproteobacteria bacterium]
MSTFFKYLGHAGFWIRTDKSDFLMDPWFSPNGAYYSGWYQWPPNQKILANIIQEISYSDKKLFIYLSHEHEDHFCEYTLENITKNKKATFIIPDFEDKNFENTIRKKFNNYNKLLVIKDKKTTVLEDFKVTLFVDDKGINHDSAILFNNKKFTFFNQNDCKMFDRFEEVIRINSKIDYYACQFSGANWHPSTFIMDENLKKTISEKRNLQKFKTIEKSIKKLSCSNYIASAGPVCFLDPEEDYINKNIYNFPNSKNLYDFLKINIKENNTNYNFLSPYPGDFINEKNQVANSKYYNIKSYRKEFYKGRPVLNVKMQDIIKFLNKKLNSIKPIIHLCNFQAPIIFSLNNQHFIVDFDKVKIKIIEENDFPEIYLRVFAPEWWYNLMVNNISGQSLCLTMSPRILRINEYCIFQNLFLFTNLTDIVIAFKQTLNISNKRCVVQCNGINFEINRYCPHQGADLQNSTIENNILTCPRHNISFDLSNDGKALDGIKLSLQAKKIS